MWLLSKVAFLEVAEDQDDDQVLVAGSWYQDDLETARERYWPRLGPTRCTPELVPPWRARITRAGFLEGLARLVADVDYAANFGGVVGDEIGLGREAICERISTILRQGRDLEMDLEAAEVLRRSRP